MTLRRRPKTSQTNGRARAASQQLTATVLALLRTESSAGALLLLAAIAALVWANSPWSASYETFWHRDPATAVGLEGGGHLRDWVNEGLMTLFFFVVGLEIKREFAAGEFREWRKAALPVLAAAGGMLLPALIFLAINGSAAGSRGWGIPMATDIAFAVGVVSLLGKRIPPALKLFLLAVAIADDVGAIVVIALFYSAGLDLGYALVALLLLAAMAGLRPALADRPAAWAIAAAVALSVGVWGATLQSGIHATLAGVAVAFVLPLAHASAAGLQGIERFELRTHRLSSFFVLPVFALANAGVRLPTSGTELAADVALGVAAGLVVGKAVGITGGAWLATKARIGALPAGVSWSQLLPVACIAGIGFSVSLFITDLAFADDRLVQGAKLGVLIGSLTASVLGSVIALRFARAPATDAS